MSELSSRAREILHTGRGQNRPTDADRERVENALRERLGAALLLAETGYSQPAARPRWQFVTGGIVGAGVVGGALFLAAQRVPVAPVQRPLVATDVATPNSAPTPPTPVEAPLTDDTTAPKAITSSAPVTPSVRPAAAQDTLAQEVALLARATGHLHAGRAVDALKVLDEYQRRFPKGLLTEERRAARAQALCSLGRQSEAQAELARLAPHSLAAARAKQVCDARSQTEK